MQGNFSFATCIAAFIFVLSSVEHVFKICYTCAHVADCSTFNEIAFLPDITKLQMVAALDVHFPSQRAVFQTFLMLADGLFLATTFSNHVALCAKGAPILQL